MLFSNCRKSSFFHFFGGEGGCTFFLGPKPKVNVLAGMAWKFSEADTKDDIDICTIYSIFNKIYTSRQISKTLLFWSKVCFRGNRPTFISKCQHFETAMLGEWCVTWRCCQTSFYHNINHITCIILTTFLFRKSAEMSRPFSYLNFVTLDVEMY